MAGERQGKAPKLERKPAAHRPVAKVLVEVPLPAVLTVAKDIAQPRMPSIAGVRAAAGVPVAVLSAACAQADPARSGLAGSPTQVVRSFVPERSDTCEVLEGSVPQQAARIIALAEEAGL